jgi:hypothetical protein
VLLLHVDHHPARPSREHASFGVSNEEAIGDDLTG